MKAFGGGMRAGKNKDFLCGLAFGGTLVLMLVVGLIAKSDGSFLWNNCGSIFGITPPPGIVTSLSSLFKKVIKLKILK